MTDCFAGVPMAGEAEQVGDLDVEVRPDRGPGFDFGRLVRLVQDNERLLAELETVRLRTQQAWRYLAEPDGNAVLAIAQIERLRLKRSALLAHLRANRVEARTMLGTGPSDDKSIDINRIELN